MNLLSRHRPKNVLYLSFTLSKTQKSPLAAGFFVDNVKERKSIIYSVLDTDKPGMYKINETFFIFFICRF